MPIATKNIQVDTADPVVGFEDERAAGSGWSRFLTINGDYAYNIGTCCETCAFLFERVGVYNDGLLPSELSANFRAGLAELAKPVLNTVSKLLPKGDYIATLIEINPRKVNLNSPDNYFANEQLDVWGTDGFWGLPHHPRVEYYRGKTQTDNAERHFFEFIVPTVAPTCLEQDEVNDYIAAIASGVRPTVLAVSVLDVKCPAIIGEGSAKLAAHWCLAHYILDGHHKLAAAASSGKPITMLSFLSKDASMAGADDIEAMVKTLL